ncbi:Origin recognition complex subunit 1 [Aphelenchoides fujianensis]|nr:Origin recognition complex subunit 1 [Aphelenchoides fujianensis]
MSDRVLRARRSLVNYADLEPLGRRPKAVQATPTKRKQPADEDFDPESDAPSDDDTKWSPASKSGRTPPKSPRKSLNRGRSTDRTPTKRTPKNSPSKSPSKSPKINSPKRTSFRTMTGDLQYDLEVPKPRPVARTLNFDAEITLQDENLDPELHEDDDEEDEPPKPKNSRMHEARARLWRDEAVKNELLHRTDEIHKITKVVADFVNGGSETRCLFLAGVPGVGKTSCVLQAVSQFRAQKRARPFKFINLNGGQMIKPDELYIHFYTELVGHVGKISISMAQSKLRKKMASHERNSEPVILLVDELDFLVTKTQSVIYDVYDWAANPHSNVAVIGISNTLDLPTRVLLPKIQSRMGTNTIHFQPYDYAQLIDIVRARFAECGDVIRSDAIEFGSRRVANMSGDVRKVMDILRKAFDIAIDAEAPEVTIKHLDAAIKETKNDYRLCLFQAFSEDQRAFFTAVYQQVAAAEELGTTFGRAYRMYQKICADQHRPAADVFAAMRMAQEGARLGFYNLGDAPGTFNRKIVLAFFGYEAKFYLEYKTDEADKRKPADVPKKPEISRSQPAAPKSQPPPKPGASKAASSSQPIGAAAKEAPKGRGRAKKQPEPSTEQKKAEGSPPLRRSTRSQTRNK